MKLRALIVAALAAVLLAMPGMAVAKGGLPTAATIHGKDLAAPITLRGNGEPGSGTDLAILVQHGGLFAAMFQPDQESGLVPNRPSTDLGARYTVTYLIPRAAGGSAKVRQDLYPYAAGGPVTYTPTGQLGAEGRGVQAGWWQATPGFRGSLIALGLPDRPARGALAPEPARPAVAARRATSAAGWWLAGGYRRRAAARHRHGAVAGAAATRGHRPLTRHRRIGGQPEGCSALRSGVFVGQVG